MKYRAMRSLLLAGKSYRRDETVDSGDHTPERLSSYIRLGLLEPIAPKKPRPKPAVVITDEATETETEEDA